MLRSALFIASVALVFLIYETRGDCSCGNGLSCCNGQCYDASVYSCLNDENNAMLCPIGLSLCGQSCYDTSASSCCNYRLCPLDDQTCCQSQSSSGSPEQSPSSTASPQPTTSQESWMYGVCIGGWQVIEPFITPSLFTDPRVQDEWTMGLYYGNTDLLTTHWDTWVTYNNLETLRSAGITHLRVPIGYWILMTADELQQYGEPYTPGGWPYLVRLIQWCKPLGLQVIIDLHAAPGRQNPWPHSGLNNNQTWGQGDTINRTLDILSRLSQQIIAMESDGSTSGVVAGLELLNEPWPTGTPGGLQTIQNFYITAYHTVRSYLPAGRYVILIDWAFTPDGWNGFMSDTSQYSNVVLDEHLYQCFDAGLNQASYATHLSVACTATKQQVEQQTLPVAVGEWSLGYKEPSDQAATEPFPTPDQQSFLYSFFVTQTKVFQAGNSRGWFFWTFKTESAAMWDYLLGISNNWIPALPVDNQAYQSACS